jgi:hypothetical protein
VESTRWKAVLALIEEIMAELDTQPSRADVAEWDARAAIHEAHEKVEVCVERMQELEREDFSH